MAQYLKTFEADTLNAAPAGMTERWATADSDWIVRSKTPSCPGGRVLEHSATVGQRRGLSLDSVDSDLQRGNVEILAFCRTSGISAFQLRLMARGTGLFGAEFGYTLTLSSGTHIKIWKLVNSVETEIASVGFVWSADTVYAMRLRAEEGTISGKVWPYGGTEPGAFMLSAPEDVAIPRIGFNGLSAGDSGGLRDFYFVSIATNGETAAMPSISGNEIRVTQQFAIVELLDPNLPGNPGPPSQAIQGGIIHLIT